MSFDKCYFFHFTKIHFQTLIRVMSAKWQKRRFQPSNPYKNKNFNYPQMRISLLEFESLAKRF